jgi:hypothetical protein
MQGCHAICSSSVDIGAPIHEQLHAGRMIIFSGQVQGRPTERHAATADCSARPKQNTQDGSVAVGSGVVHGVVLSRVHVGVVCPAGEQRCGAEVHQRPSAASGMHQRRAAVDVSGVGRGPALEQVLDHFELPGTRRMVQHGAAVARVGRQHHVLAKLRNDCPDRAEIASFGHQASGSQHRERAERRRARARRRQRLLLPPLLPLGGQAGERWLGARRRRGARVDSRHFHYRQHVVDTGLVRE